MVRQFVQRSRSPTLPGTAPSSLVSGQHVLAYILLASVAPPAMDNIERTRREQADYRDLPRHPHDRHPPTDSDGEPDGYTLMVAGRRTGKTSFLRLLLDTSVISPSATHEQLQSVAKFIQGCAGFTPHVRSVSVNIDQAVADDNGRQDIQTLNLTLIDTPSLDYEDEHGSQQVVSEILRHLDARFSESLEDVSTLFSLPLPSPTDLRSPQDRKASTGDHHVHL